MARGFSRRRWRPGSRALPSPRSAASCSPACAHRVTTIPVQRLLYFTFSQVGRNAYFLRDFARALADPRTYLPQTIRQMKNVGVESIPLVALVSAFIGAVVALQTRYQLLPGVELTAVGWIARQMIVLELGPLLTGLVLTGRVGARFTAEIGTMRVTEQIDALETLAYDPVAYLVVPRMLAAIIMLPVLTILANALMIGSALVTAVVAADVPPMDFIEGLRIAFVPFQIVYSLIKATLFGAAIAFFCTYAGFHAGTGAEGVGRSTAQAVVVASVAILVLDAIIALLLARFLQA